MKTFKRIWYTKALSILNVSHYQLTYALSRQCWVFMRINFESTMQALAIISLSRFSHFDVLSDHIGEWNTPHFSPLLWAWGVGLCSSLPLPSYSCHFKAPGSHLSSSVSVLIGAGTLALLCCWHDWCHKTYSDVPLSWTWMQCSEIKVLCHQCWNLIPPARHLSCS